MNKRINKRIRNIGLGFFVLIIIISFTGCDLFPTAVDGVNIDKDDQSLEEGDIVQLTATVTPENATNKEVTWESNDESVATVDEDGLVTAVEVGTATITVIADDDDDITDTVEITVNVNEAVVNVTGVSIQEGDQTLVEGDTVQLTATVEPEDATNYSIAWESSKPHVADVIDNGLVIAKAEGRANITVNVIDHDSWLQIIFTDTVEITVNVNEAVVTGVSIQEGDQTLVEGDTVQLTATVEPEDATNKDVTWESDDESVATIDEDGLVSAVAEGTAVITVTTEDGKFTASIPVSVRKETSEIDLGSLSTNFNEETKITISLPQQDTNGNEVLYTDAVANVPADFEKVHLDGRKLTLKGERDIYGDYQIHIEFKDHKKETYTTILEGKIYNLIDISGNLEDAETDSPRKGVIRVYNLETIEPIDIDIIYEGEKIIGNPYEDYKVITTDLGEFSFQLNKRAGVLENVLLQARIGTPGNYESYVRSIELSGEKDHNPIDNPRANPAIRAVSYEGLESLSEDGETIEQEEIELFKDFLDEINFRPLYDWHPKRGIVKWDLEGISDYPFKGVIIYENQWDGTGHFNEDAINSIKEMIEREPGIIGGKVPEISVRHYNGESPGYGYILIRPHLGKIDGADGIVTKSVNYDGYIKGAASKNRVDEEGNIHSLKVLTHEYTLQTFADWEPYNTVENSQSITPHNVILDSPSSIDKKAAQIIYEETYPTGEGIRTVLGMDWFDLGMDWFDLGMDWFD